MESERDAWGLSSADWCHVAINFKRSARIVQTSFPVLLFLKKKKKKEEEEPFPLVLRPRCTLFSRFTSFRTPPLWITRVYPHGRKWRDARRSTRANFFESVICDIEEKVTSGFFYFFWKGEIRMWVLVNIVNIDNLWDCDL